MLEEASNQRAHRRYDEWRRAHQGKYRFATRRHAWWAIFAMCRRRRRLDVHLTPYVCRWSNDPAAGRRAAEPHLHVGHGKRRWPPVQALWDWRKRTRFWRNKLVVWPYCRARRRYRFWRAERLASASTRPRRPGRE